MWGEEGGLWGKKVSNLHNCLGVASHFGTMVDGIWEIPTLAFSPCQGANPWEPSRVLEGIPAPQLGAMLKEPSGAKQTPIVIFQTSAQSAVSGASCVKLILWGGAWKSTITFFSPT